VRGGQDVRVLNAVPDAAAFADLVERHRRELRVHCYRMLGSYSESEDLVQETFLRAWRNIGGFAGRSSVRTWLYRIATNACLDHLAGRARRVLPDDLGAPPVPVEEIEWLQPYPDRLWEPAGPEEAEPGNAVVTRETIELAFLAAIQHLPPRQRAVLILRDVLGWPAADTAGALDLSVAAANSALQRGRVTLREHLPERRLDWRPAVEPTGREREVLRRYMDAVERADLAAVADLLAADVRATMPPYRIWFAGRSANLAALRRSWDPASPDFVGRFRMAATRANGCPAAAAWTNRDGSAYRAFAITVLRIEGGRIAGMTAFHDTRLFPAFGLPMSFPVAGRLPG
jgi:RNA polymerase sigma-70 factor (ECF subfamily)